MRHKHESINRIFNPFEINAPRSRIPNFLLCHSAQHTKKEKGKLGYVFSELVMIPMLIHPPIPIAAVILILLPFFAVVIAVIIHTDRGIKKGKYKEDDNEDTFSSNINPNPNDSNINPNPNDSNINPNPNDSNINPNDARI